MRVRQDISDLLCCSLRHCQFELRFDAGGWWRYDDSQVDQTKYVDKIYIDHIHSLHHLFNSSLERVIGGNGRRDGYIFTYVHQPQWDLWTT